MHDNVDILKVSVILGTKRKGNQTQKAARFVHKVGENIEEIDVKLVDIQDFDFPFDGYTGEAENEEFTKIIHNSDALFIVMPEYNHGFPGSLKRALDSVRLKNYIHKPVALAGVSSGRWGGVRGIESFVPLAREYGMIVSFTDVQFPQIKDLFDEQEEIQDEKYIERVKRSYDELIWLTRCMKYGIENLPNKHHE